MKIDKDTLIQMQTGMQAILPYYLAERKTTLKEMQGQAWFLNDLWFNTYTNTVRDGVKDIRIYKDITGQRVLQHNQRQELYPCNTNDNTLATALNRIQLTHKPGNKPQK